MDTSRAWRYIGIVVGAPPALLFAAYDVYQWAQAYASDHFHNDFTFYYMAARLGLAHGWPSLYNLTLQQQGLDAIGSHIKIAELARYISPPPLAWMAIPFTPLPYEMAYWIWSALLLAALAGAWYLAAPGAGLARVILLIAALGWLPVIYGLQLGQPGLFVALGVAASYALLRAKRDFWAGVALGVLALKPQLAFLVPIALLVARKDRAFIGSVVALGALAIASVVALGPHGVNDYLARLNYASGVPVNRQLTLAALIGNLAVTRAVQVVIALWALALAFRLGRRNVEWIFVPALVGGLLASPYLHLDDLVMLGLAGWLYLRIEPQPRWAWVYVLGAVLAAEGLTIWGLVPLVALELGALVLMTAAAVMTETRAGRILPQIDGRPLELRQRP